MGDCCGYEDGKCSVWGSYVIYCILCMCEVSSFVQLCDILPQEYRNEFDVYGMWSTFEFIKCVDESC